MASSNPASGGSKEAAKAWDIREKLRSSSAIHVAKARKNRTGAKLFESCCRRALAPLCETYRQRGTVILRRCLATLRPAVLGPGTTMLENTSTSVLSVIINPMANSANWSMRSGPAGKGEVPIYQERPSAGLAFRDPHPVAWH